ncbi:MAG: hypothetical protein QF441_14590 [Bacteriovoracaceae bacterium]|jgi:hypothetical protein|nr:hypothetical protein [Bacteriovoracaceae bacterium]|tara:strand:+ start:140 stop:430 length:291 start_codon:yes stop_codon:yes gene_type:complete
MDKNNIELDKKEYLEKKLNVAKEILPILLAQKSLDYITDVRKRGSLVYNTVAIADHLLIEVGFSQKGETASHRDSNEDRTAIRKLSELLKEDKEEE